MLRRRLGIIRHCAGLVTEQKIRPELGFGKRVPEHTLRKQVKMIAFWDIAPFGLVQVHRRFNGAYCLMMEAVRTCGMSVYFRRLHGAISQKAIIFILAAVRT
jgi:hypothetical protein